MIVLAQFWLDKSVGVINKCVDRHIQLVPDVKYLHTLHDNHRTNHVNKTIPELKSRPWNKVLKKLKSKRPVMKINERPQLHLNETCDKINRQMRQKIVSAMYPRWTKRIRGNELLSHQQGKINRSFWCPTRNPTHLKLSFCIFGNLHMTVCKAVTRWSTGLQQNKTVHTLIGKLLLSTTAETKEVFNSWLKISVD